MCCGPGGRRRSSSGRAPGSDGTPGRWSSTAAWPLSWPAGGSPSSTSTTSNICIEGSGRGSARGFTSRCEEPPSRPCAVGIRGRRSKSVSFKMGPEPPVSS
jgi:hypothetical protein